MKRALVLLFVGLTACTTQEVAQIAPLGDDYTGPLMRPGENCLRCHNERSNTGAPPWSAGGTIYARRDDDANSGIAGVRVTITDANGQVVELTTNEVGNFYTAVALANPFEVEIEGQGVRRKMPVAPPAGSCNACHDVPPVGGAPGRIYLHD